MPLRQLVTNMLDPVFKKVIGLFMTLVCMVFFLGVRLGHDHKPIVRKVEDAKEPVADAKRVPAQAAPRNSQSATAERRTQAAENRAARVAEEKQKIETQAAFLGVSSAEMWRQRQLMGNPNGVRSRENDERLRQKAQDLAEGINVDLWQREEELAVLSSKLDHNMTVSSVTNLLGEPFKVETHTVVNGVGKRLGVPWIELQNIHQPFSLIYSPHTTKAHHNMGDMFRVLTISFDENKRLVSWDYSPPNGTW